MDKKNIVLIIIIIFLLFIILSGIILYIFMMNKPEESKIKEITINKDVVLYEFDEPFVNNVKNGTEMVKLSIKLDVDKRLVELLDNRKFEIIDKINLIMRAKTAEDLKGVEGQLKVKAEIRDAIKKIISTEKKIEVFVEEMILQ